MIWPLATPAQQPAMPVIGFLHSGTAAPFEAQLAAFQQGLKEGGYLVGQTTIPAPVGHRLTRS
jgi:putative ABC transport system substrate-binding protein